MPRHHGTGTVLAGLLGRSALYSVLAEIEALRLDLVEMHQLTRIAPYLLAASSRALCILSLPMFAFPAADAGMAENAPAMMTALDAQNARICSAAALPERDQRPAPNGGSARALPDLLRHSV